MVRHKVARPPNLMRLHDLLASENTGDFITLETSNDRTLFFDLLSLGFRAPSGMLLQFKLFTVPGQVQHDSTRKAVLSRADAWCLVLSQNLNVILLGEIRDSETAEAAMHAVLTGHQVFSTMHKKKY